MIFERCIFDAQQYKPVMNYNANRPTPIMKIVQLL